MIADRLSPGVRTVVLFQPRERDGTNCFDSDGKSFSSDRARTGRVDSEPRCRSLGFENESSSSDSQEHTDFDTLYSPGKGRARQADAFQRKQRSVYATVPRTR